MVNFLLLIEKATNFSKQDIDRGQTPPEIYNLCSSIRETFCLSYAIRKYNNLYLYFQEECVLIKFKGKDLRYLGPDERSQALLLEKALKKSNKIISIKNSKWEKSTPGIYVRKFSDKASMINFFKTIMVENNFIIEDNQQNFDEKVGESISNNYFIEISESDFFIIPTYLISSRDSDMIKTFEEVKNIKYISLSKIKGVENKILYINFRKDNQKVLKNQ
ncbi:MAG: hypothetical protein JSV62_08465 [Promethearchaeota archaeon]|nr:MAG: hypothetical protein JSV62_08465 [Candidatus Lokiarchaeota archaeon]